MIQQTPAPTRWFTCAICDLLFQTDWPKTAAEAEYQATFPDVSGPKIEVCPDCYLRVLNKHGITPQH